MNKRRYDTFAHEPQRAYVWMVWNFAGEECHDLSEQGRGIEIFLPVCACSEPVPIGLDLRTTKAILRAQNVGSEDAQPRVLDFAFEECRHLFTRQKLLALFAAAQPVEYSIGRYRRFVVGLKALSNTGHG